MFYKLPNLPAPQEQDSQMANASAAIRAANINDAEEIDLTFGVRLRELRERRPPPARPQPRPLARALRPRRPRNVNWTRA